MKLSCLLFEVAFCSLDYNNLQGTHKYRMILFSSLQLFSSSSLIYAEVYFVRKRYSRFYFMSDSVTK